MPTATRTARNRDRRHRATSRRRRQSGAPSNVGETSDWRDALARDGRESQRAVEEESTTSTRCPPIRQRPAAGRCNTHDANVTPPTQTTPDPSRRQSPGFRRHLDRHSRRRAVRRVDVVARLARRDREARRGVHALSALRDGDEPGAGRGKSRTPDLMCVGEAPGATEDETGRPFVGAAGQLLTKILAAIESAARRGVHLQRVEASAAG